MSNTLKKIFKIYIRSSFEQYEKYYFLGTKENLMSLIGCLYSTRLVHIERISYEEVKVIPKDFNQIRYFIFDSGEINIFYN